MVIVLRSGVSVPALISVHCLLTFHDRSLYLVAAHGQPPRRDAFMEERSAAIGHSLDFELLWAPQPNL